MSIKTIENAEDLLNTSLESFNVGWDSDAFKALRFELGFEKISDEITCEGRWRNWHEILVKRVSDGQYFEYDIELGSNENCDDSEEDIEVFRVYPKQVTKTVYLRKNTNE